MFYMYNGNVSAVLLYRRAGMDKVKGSMEALSAMQITADTEGNILTFLKMRNYGRRQSI